MRTIIHKCKLKNYMNDVLPCVCTQFKIKIIMTIWQLILRDMFANNKKKIIITYFRFVVGLARSNVIQINLMEPKIR